MNPQNVSLLRTAPFGYISRRSAIRPAATSGSVLLERNLEPKMNEFVDPLVFWAAAAVQVLGLASVLFARLPRACTAHDYGRGIYIGCLVLLMATTVASPSTTRQPI